MADNNDLGSFLAGFIVGGLIGAGVALLIAPQSGEETRTLIRDKSIELKDKASTSASQIVEQSKEKVSTLYEQQKAKFGAEKGVEVEAATPDAPTP